MTAVGPSSTSRPASSSTSRSSWIVRSLPSVVGGWITARLLVWVSFAIAERLAGSVQLPYGRLHLDEGLLFWDGQYYRSIAESGYHGSSPDSVRFFPGYPLVSRWLAPIIGGRIDIALVVVANLSVLAALFVLWKLVTELGYDDAVASRSVLVTALFPAATVTAFGYAEGPFLLCLTLAALYVTRRRPVAAIAPLFLLGLIRPTGILVGAAVAAAGWIDYRHASRAHAPESPASSWDWLRWVPALVAPVAGQLAFLAWLPSIDVDRTAPLDYQRQFRAGFRDPFTRMIEAAWSVFTGDFKDAYNLGFAVVLLVALVIALRRRVARPWTIYLAAGLVVACSANNIDSLGRYGLLLVPAWPIAVALATAQRARLAVVLTVSSAAFVWFTTAALLGRVIP